jgi:hypothetical protein
LNNKQQQSHPGNFQTKALSYTKIPAATPYFGPVTASRFNTVAFFST